MNSRCTLVVLLVLDWLMLLIDAKAVQLNLRLAVTEIYFVDLAQFSSQIRSLRVTQASPKEGLSNHWSHQDYFVYSVKAEDCIEKGKLSPHLAMQPMLPRHLYEDELWTKYYPYNLTTRQVLSRQLQVADRGVTVTTTYLESVSNLDGSTSFVNLMETKSVKYNQSAIDISDYHVEDRSWHAIGALDSDGWPAEFTPPDWICVTGTFIASFNETLYVCLSRPSENATSVYLYRSRIGVYYHLRDLDMGKRSDGSRHNFTTTLYAGFQVTVVAAPQQIFEMFVHMTDESFLFLLRVTRKEVLSIEFFVLNFRISELHYIKKTLILFGSDMENTYKTYYLHRIPGREFEPTAVKYFADARFLGSLYSNENVEIILEMYKQLPLKKMSQLKVVPGFIPPVTHLLYSFNLLSHSVSLISTQAHVVALNKNFWVGHSDLKSFSNHGTIMAINYLHILNVNTGEPFDIVGIELRLDDFDGAGIYSRVVPQNDFLYWNYKQDPRTGDYFILHQPKDLRDYNNSFHACEMWVQRTTRPHIRVQFTSNSEDRSRGLILKLEDTTSNQTFITMNCSLIPETDPALPIKAEIWKGSNMTRTPIKAGSRLQSIEVERMVRGNFIVRNHSDPAFRDRPHFPYYAATIDEANILRDLSMYQIDNFHILNKNDLPAGGTNSVIAFGVTKNKSLKDRILFVRMNSHHQRGYSFYRLPAGSSHMVPFEFEYIPDRITQVIPLQENQYLLVNEQHQFALFYPHNMTYLKSQLEFNCSTLVPMPHNRIRPSLLCFSGSLDFRLFFIGELITGLHNRGFDKNYFVDITFQNNERLAVSRALSQDAVILTSEAYQNLVFVYCKAAKLSEADFHVFYVDVDETHGAYYDHSYNLKSLALFGKGVYLAKIQSLEFVEDRLVVHYRINESQERVYFYTAVDKSLTLAKQVTLPSKYRSMPHARLMTMARKLIGCMAASRKSYLLLEVSVVSNHGDHYNVLVIDPFAPQSETIPTVLLTKPAESSSPSKSLAFPYYVASLDGAKHQSIGLLHYLRNPNNFLRSMMERYYLFQIFRPDSPRVYFRLQEKRLSRYKEIFWGSNPSRNLSIRFAFHSDLDPSIHLATSLSIVKAATVANNVAQLQDNSTRESKIRLQTLYNRKNRSDLDSRMQVLSANFSNFVKDRGIVKIDWRVEPETIYDKSFGTFTFNNPLTLVETIEGIEANSIVNIDTFCRAYKLSKGELRCSKIGWILFHKNEIEILYKENLTEVISQDSVRFPFNVNECTESVVANHSLISACTYDNNLVVMVTDLLDLRQKLIDTATLGISPKTSRMKIVKTYEKAFILLYSSSRTVTKFEDTANVHYFTYELGLLSNSTDSCPRITSDLLYIGGWQSKLIDSALGVGRILEHSSTYLSDSQNISRIGPVYKMSSLNIDVANQASVQLFEESYHIGPIETIDDGKTSQRFEVTKASLVLPTVLRLKMSQETRVVAMARPSIFNIVFDPEDAVARNETDDHYYRYSLIHFPSYHSYLYRYKKTNALKNTSWFKLENPFAELEGNSWDDRPVCFRWACLMVSTFDGNQNFVRVYDMLYELLSGPKLIPNFAVNFPRQAKMENTTETSSPTVNDGLLKFENAALELDEIHDNYTIRPIQVLNTTDLKLIRFDESRSTADTLVVLAFFKDRRTQVYSLRRKATLVVNNLYFMSSFVDIKVRTTYNKVKTARVIIEKFVESDYYKYWIHLVVVLVAAVLLIVFNHRLLKYQQKLTREEVRRRTKEKYSKSILELMSRRIDCAKKIKSNVLEPLNHQENSKVCLDRESKSVAVSVESSSNFKDGIISSTM